MGQTPPPVDGDVSLHPSAPGKCWDRGPGGGPTASTLRSNPKVGHVGGANQPGGVWDVPCSPTPGTAGDVEGDKWPFLPLSKDLHHARAPLTPSLLHRPLISTHSH